MVNVRSSCTVSLLDHCHLEISFGVNLSKDLMEFGLDGNRTE